MHEMSEFKSGNGDTTHGSFILCTFIPDMVAMDCGAVYSKVVGACKLAEKTGVGVVTLGGTVATGASGGACNVEITYICDDAAQ